jgi:hypothetical protein
MGRSREGVLNHGSDAVTRKRPLADRIEVGAPGLAALAARTIARLPEPVRRRALRSAFDRARDAFNRGDLEAVFALFAAGVEYGPPPPLYEGPPLRGRTAVFDFWRGVHGHYETSTIENLSLEEARPNYIVRRARLHHHSRGTVEDLSYVITQTTELRAGRVVRQLNVLADDH